MRKCIMILVVLFISSPIWTQRGFQIGPELQVYPTGIISGLVMEKFTSTRGSIYLRGGYNWFRHRNLGVHDDEIGDGVGFSFGYKTYFNDTRNRWRIGLKNDFWWNHVLWVDYASDGTLLESGETDIMVLQPTVELSFTRDVHGWQLSPSFALGFEWNIKTEGSPTGQGVIILIGILWTRNF